MKFDNIVEELLESTSPLRTMYHITKMANAANIIATDKFELAEQDESGEKLFPKFKNYLSTARNLSSSYIKGKIGLTMDKVLVIFELNASALSDKGYVIKPMHDFMEIDDAESLELEDRILTNKPFINNASSFIKTINLLHPPNFANTFSQSGVRKSYSINDAYKIFKNSGIPTFVFTGARAFSLLDKRKAKLLK
jgi:hypothetical protein